MGYDITLGLLSKKTSSDLVEKILNNSPLKYSDNKQIEFIDRKIKDIKKCMENHKDFSNGSGYGLAMIFQSLDKSWYLRGNWYSKIFEVVEIKQLLESKRKTKNSYLISWEEILPKNFNSGENSDLNGNYSIGAISSPEKLKLFISDYKEDRAFRKLVNNYLEHNIYPLLDAVLTAIKEMKFLFEAESLIQPSMSFSNPPTYLYSLDKCNAMGAKLFYFVSQYQITSLNNDLEEAKKSEKEFQKTVEDYYNLLNKEYGNLIPKFTPEEGFKIGLSHYIQKKSTSDIFEDLKNDTIVIENKNNTIFYYEVWRYYTNSYNYYYFWIFIFIIRYDC